MEKLKLYLRGKEYANNVAIILSELKEDRDYTKTKIENVINAIIESELESETKNAILQFVKLKKFKSNTQQRLLRVLYTLKKSFEMYEPNFKKTLQNDDVETMYVHYLESDWAESTRETNWGIMKDFFKHQNLDVQDYKFKKPREYLEPSKLLNEKDIFILLKLCRNLQEKVLLCLFWDCGARVEEILGLSIENFSKDKKYYFVTLRGKTGTRFIPLYWSSPILDKFLKEKEGHIFWNEYHNEFTKKNVDKFLKRLEEHSKLNKKLYSHLFRHSRATYLAKYLTDRQMCYYFGWSVTSKMPGRYSHLNGYDLVEKMLEVYKIEKKLKI